jgi:hypothetical protein
MDKDFTLYEEAFALKELGFNEPCLGYYLCRNSAFGIDDLEITTERIDLIRYDYASCAVPTYSQAFRWFRDKYQLIHYISWVYKKTYDGVDWFFNIKGINMANNNVIPHDETRFGTYEEAELECLKKLIEIVKGGNK